MDYSAIAFLVKASLIEAFLIKTFIIKTFLIQTLSTKTSTYQDNEQRCHSEKSIFEQRDQFIS